MNNSQPAREESHEGELQHYVNERPDLLLKMLDVAEACWQERAGAAVNVLDERPGPEKKRVSTLTLVSCAQSSR